MLLLQLVVEVSCTCRICPCVLQYSVALNSSLIIVFALVPTGKRARGRPKGSVDKRPRSYTARPRAKKTPTSTRDSLWETPVLPSPEVSYSCCTQFCWFWGQECDFKNVFFFQRILKNMTRSTFRWSMSGHARMLKPKPNRLVPCGMSRGSSISGTRWRRTRRC